MSSEQTQDANALRAGTWYVVSSIVVKGIAVLSTPIFTRIMSKAEYGMVATFLSWYSLLYPLCTSNLSFSVGRAKIDYPGSLDKFINSIQLLSLLMSMITIGLMLLFKNLFIEFFALTDTIYNMLLVYLAVSPIIEFRQNYYRYKYKYKQNIAIAWFLSFASVLLSVIMMCFGNGDKATLRVYGIVIPNMILSIYFWMCSLKSGPIRYNCEFWKYGLRISCPLIFHTFSLNILSQSDRIFITKYCGSGDAGIYSLVYSYGLLITVITNAVADGWLPWFHDSFYVGKFAEIRKNVKWIVLLGCYIGLACIAFAPEAVMVLGGKSYLNGVNCVPPIVIGVVCQFIYTHYVNIELHLKKTKFVAVGTVFAATLNIVLNSYFVPKYGYVAAAYTTLASYVVLLVMHYVITKYFLRVSVYSDTFMFVSIVVTSVLAVIIKFTYEKMLVRYTIIFIGAISFFVLFRNYFIRFCESLLIKLRSRKK